LAYAWLIVVACFLCTLVEFFWFWRVCALRRLPPPLFKA
jgi:hypothetical protein